MNVAFKQLQCATCPSTTVSWNVAGVLLCQACAEVATTAHARLDAELASAVVTTILAHKPPTAEEGSP